MGCLVAILGLFFPRLAIVALVVFSDYIGRAYDTFLWPFLGFLFMPFTTLAYAAAINQHGNVSGLWLALVVLAVLLDLGVLGDSSRRKLKGPRVERP